MNSDPGMPPYVSPSWQTKPTDRFILKWIKKNLSARISPHLAVLPWVRPWMITVASALLGTLAGLIYGLGLAWLAGLMAAAAQVLDGVDGQVARLTHRQSPAGAFLDSCLDRYADGAMIAGMTAYLIMLPLGWPVPAVVILGVFALIGSNMVSYSTARAESLNIDLGRPTLASKGTRTAVMILCAWGSLAWPPMPAVSLIYLVLHPNAVVLARVLRAHRRRPSSAKIR